MHTLPRDSVAHIWCHNPAVHPHADAPVRSPARPSLRHRFPLAPTRSRPADRPRAHRGAVLPIDGLLRYQSGKALTTRRYDHLWHRLGEQLPWVAAQGISTHWLRHTTLTWVERHFGYGIARAYAGHTDSTGPATTTYIKADLEAVATALMAMTGQVHPLASKN